MISDLIKKLITKVEDHCYVKNSDISAFRVFYGLFMLFSAFPVWQWIGKLPNSLFNPPIISIANLFNGFLSPNSFLLLQLFFYFLLLFIIFGIYSRWALFLLFLIGIFCNSFQYSFGKIDHNIMIYILPLILSFTNCGRYYSILKDKPIKKEIQKIFLGFLSISFVFAMFSAGFQKGLSWIDFDINTSGFLRWFYSGYFNLGRRPLLGQYISVLPKAFFEILDYTAVIFELSGIIFLLWSRKIYLIIASVFHLINLLVLDINFQIHLVIYALFLIGPFLNQIMKFVYQKSFLKRSIIFLIISRWIYISIIQIYNFPSIVETFDMRYLSIFIWLVFISLSIYLTFFKPQFYNLKENFSDE